ncbi:MULTISPECIES: DivIVA domain-containing protein [Limnochorda]|uniref:DivIVA domain-containing protein n=1 Tax=Limnochorda TaxID=1676651 RepID=UPI001ED72D4E|nr:DivIVA domain-containing protein [Limnochorda pilosa]MBO2520052.1 hypothetical protein [Bacillota bacterium]
MLTPRALRHIEFRKVFRGYDPQEVDEFLGRLIEEYERLRERVERGAEPGRERAPEPARERAEGLPEGAKGGSAELSADLREAAALARQAADELRANAQWEARLIVEEARQRAARIEAEARERVSREQTRLRELREEVDRLLRQLRRLTEAYLDSPAPGEALNRRPDSDEPAWEPERGAAEDDEDDTRAFPAVTAPEPEEGDEEDDGRTFLRYTRG